MKRSWSFSCFYRNKVENVSLHKYGGICIDGTLPIAFYIDQAYAPRISHWEFGRSEYLPKPKLTIWQKIIKFFI